MAKQLLNSPSAQSQKPVFWQVRLQVVGIFDKNKLSINRHIGLHVISIRWGTKKEQKVQQTKTKRRKRN
jgi:hypothetical protein